MVSKLLSLLATAKGAAAAGVLATAAVSGATVATNDDARQAVQEATENVTRVVTGAAPKTGDEAGKPAVVAARNDADKKLRGAFKDDHTALEKLHSTHVDKTDREKLEQLVKDADKKLRDRLTKALDDVAALTLGREGRESASPRPSPKPSASPDIHATTVDQAKVDAIVTAAIADMKKIVADTTKAVVALPTFTPGKPSTSPGKAGDNKPENPGAKPESPGAKPAENPGSKPSESPGNRPSSVPPSRP